MLLPVIEAASLYPHGLAQKLHRELPGKAAQTHELLLRIRPLEDDLRRGVAVGSIVQLVLNYFEKMDGLITLWVVIHTSGIEVKHLSI